MIKCFKRPKIINVKNSEFEKLFVKPKGSKRG